MKTDVGKWGIIILLSVLSSSCSSIRARTEILDKEWTVYPGVQQDVKEVGEIFGGERPKPEWINGMVASILILDLPFSAVFDTLATPYDLYRIYTPKASAEATESWRGPSNQKAHEAGKEE